MKPEYETPKVVVSKCLGFAACRWNGDLLTDAHVDALKGRVEYLPVCPEVEMGLGVPRKPIRLVEEKGVVRLMQPDTGKDCTGDMRDFSRRFLSELGAVDGFLLKSRSPSCGPNDVKIYQGAAKGAGSRKGDGAFAARVKQAFPLAAVEHEGRLNNFALREHFYTRLFTLARFRKVREAGGMGGLVEFQAANKLLFMAYNQSRAKALGRLTANPEKLPAGEVFGLYAETLALVLARPIRPLAAINAAMHAMGYFRKGLGRAEKTHFLETLEEYRAGRRPLGGLLTLLTSWIARFGEPYLAKQTFFAPFPGGLVELSDSGKGRIV